MVGHVISLPALDITFCRRTLKANQSADARASDQPRDEASAVVALLEDAGHRVTVSEDGALGLGRDAVVWIQDNPNWFPEVCRELEGQEAECRPFSVVWHTEPLPHPTAAGLPPPRLHARELAKVLLRDRRATDVFTNFSRLRSLESCSAPDLLFVSAPGRIKFLREQGISAHWAPLGYHSLHGEDLGLDRDIDVLFIGALEIPRRKRAIAGLRSSGIEVTAMGSWSDPALWGENRTRLINRAKVFLNVQRYEKELSHMRLILGGANKALVSSEPMYDPSPYVPGKHYVSTSLEEMPSIVRRYVENEAERRPIVDELYPFVTQQMTLERSVQQILDRIAEEVGTRR